MGFEYRIKVHLSANQREKLNGILELDHHFEKKEIVNDRIFLNFRLPENKGKLPDFIVSQEPDGIYICQYGFSEVWRNLDIVKKFLITQELGFEITEL